MTVSNQKERGAVIVARVSDPSQVNGTSIDGQLAACRKTAEALGLPIRMEFVEPGVSGKFLSLRLGTQEAIRMIRDGEADTLICMNMSRYSRDVELSQQIKKAVEGVGGRLVFTDWDYKATPEGNLFFNIVSGFSEYERATIIKRTTDGRRRVAASGIQPSRTFSPFGYHIPTRTDVLLGTYPPELLGVYILTEESVWARQIFERYAEGNSLREICRFLQENNVQTPRGGQYWRPSTVTRIMGNPTYHSKAPFSRHKNVYDESRRERGLKHIVSKEVRPEADWISIDCPAIVSKELWDICKARLLEGQSMFGGSPARRHLLSGIARCPICGRGMNGSARERKFGERTVHERLYACRDNRPSRNPGKVVCNSKHYNGVEMEAIVKRVILDIASQPALVAAAIRVGNEKVSAGHSPTAHAAVQKQLESVKLKEQAAVHAQVEALSKNRDPSIYEGIIDLCAVERKSLEHKLVQMETKSRGLSDRSGADIARSVGEVLSDLNLALMAPDVTDGEKRSLIAKVVDKIVPEADGYRISMVPFSSGGPGPKSNTVQQTSDKNGASVDTVANIRIL